MKCRLLYSIVVGELEIAHMIQEDGLEYQILWTDEYEIVKPGTYDIRTLNALLGADFQPSMWGDIPEPCFKNEIPMSLELAKIQTATKVQQENEHLVVKAETAVNPVIADVTNLHTNLTTADALTLEEADQKLNGLQVKIKDSYELIESRRKPITQELDAIKSKLIEPGKAIIALGESVKSLRNSWAKEKGRREGEAEKLKQQEIAKANDMARIKKEWTDGWNAVYVGKVANSKQGIANKFYSLTEAEFPAWIEQLKAWNVSKVALDNPKAPVSTLIDAEMIQREGNKIEGALKDTFNKDWEATMSAEIEETIEKVPARISELKDAEALKASEARRKKEDEERATQAAKDEADRKAASESEAAMESLNKTMDIAAAAVPAVEKTKGTVVKQVYVAKTHKAWVALIQSWVANDMALMTIEELGKKLSFMKTAAEKHLKETGEVLQAEGLETEEDYSTRGTRGSKSKKEAA